MTKRQMAEALVRYFPKTTVAYWMRETKAVIELNYDKAVAYYGK